MTEPQVWVLIGVFAAAMFGVIGIVTSNFTRVLRSEIGGLRGEMIARFETVDARFDLVDARFNAVDARFNAVDQRFNAVDQRFESIERRLEHLDRDVSTLMRREIDRGAD